MGTLWWRSCSIWARGGSLKRRPKYSTRRSIDEEWKVYDIKPGVQHLSGLEALAFARSRTGSSDYVRMGRQRCVIAALLDQSGMAEMVWKFPSLVSAAKEAETEADTSDCWKIE